MPTRRAKVEQKHNDDQGDNDRFLNQAMFQSVYRFADQSPAVIAGHNLDSWRQRSFDLSQLLLDTIDHVECIQPIPHDHNAAHGLAFAIPLRYTFPHVRAEGNRTQIFDEYGRPVLRHHRHVRQVIERLQIAQPANHVSRTAQFQYAATDFIRTRLHAVDNGREGYAISEQFVRIKLHLILTHEPTDARNFGHTWYGCQLVTQVPVLNASKIGQALLLTVIDEHILVDPTRTGRIGTDGGTDVCGKPTGNRLQILHNPRTGPIDIGPVLKHHKDVGVIEHGLRAYRFHPRPSQQRSDDWIGDLIFDDVGWLAFPIGVNDHLHIRNVRQGVQRNVAHGPDSSQREQKYPGEDQEAIVCAPLDDSGDHDIPPVALSVSCLLAIVCPFSCALMVTSQVPPEPRSPLPSYMPPPLSPALMTVFIAAIPIAGIAAMKKVTVTFAPAIGFPSCPVSFTRTVLPPLCGGSGSVVSSTLACCCAGAFIEAA